MNIGIDLGGTNVRIGIVDNGQITQKIEKPFLSKGTERQTLDYLFELIDVIITPQVKGIGVGVPSVVDIEKGIVYNAANIPSWKEVHLKDELEKHFNIPASINNDCNCHALGELNFGEGRKFDDFVCTTLGTGVGAGIIVNRSLYCGNNNGAGEVGSLPYLDSDYEHYCSSLFFAKHNTTGAEMAQRASQGDEFAIELWTALGFHLGNLMIAILFAYDPQAIIIGGGIAKAEELFIPAMRQRLAAFPYQESVRRLHIIFSKGKDLGLLGASCLIK